MLFKMNLMIAVHHEMRFEEKYRHGPFEVADSVLRPNASDIVWERGLRKVELLSGCCTERQVLWVLATELSGETARAMKVKIIKRTFRAWGRIAVTTLRQEHENTIQRIIAGGDKGRSKTFPVQCVNYCKEVISRRFEKATGTDLSMPQTDLQYNLAKATTRNTYQKPNHIGNPIFPYMHRLKQEQNRVDVTYDEASAAWGVLTAVQQQSFKDDLRIQKTARLHEQQQQLPVASQASSAKTPWSIGDNCPTSLTVVQRFLGLFTTRAKGSAPN